MGSGGGREVTYSPTSGAGPVMLKGEATTQLTQIPPDLPATTARPTRALRRGVEREDPYVGRVCVRARLVAHS